LRNGFQKKGKVGRVFIFCFYFQSNMGRVFIFCFYFQWFKNITQTSSILLFWQTNNTIVFTLRDLDFPTDSSYFRSKLTKGLLFSPTSLTKYKNPSHVGLEIKTKKLKPYLPCPFSEIHCLRTRAFFFRWPYI
jgi:hypothetical protein